MRRLLGPFLLLLGKVWRQAAVEHLDLHNWMQEFMYRDTVHHQRIHERHVERERDSLPQGRLVGATMCHVCEQFKTA